MLNRSSISCTRHDEHRTITEMAGTHCVFEGKDERKKTLDEMRKAISNGYFKALQAAWNKKGWDIVSSTVRARSIKTGQQNKWIIFWHQRMAQGIHRIIAQKERPRKIGNVAEAREWQLCLWHLYYNATGKNGTGEFIRPAKQLTINLNLCVAMQTRALWGKSCFLAIPASRTETPKCSYWSTVL